MCLDFAASSTPRKRSRSVNLCRATSPPRQTARPHASIFAHRFPDATLFVIRSNRASIDNSGPNRATWSRLFLALKDGIPYMKNRTLTQKEVKKRVAETLSEVFAGIFKMSEQAATKKLHTAFREEMQTDNDLLQAAVVYQLNKQTRSKINSSKGRCCTELELEAMLAQLKASAPEMASEIRKGLKKMQSELPRRGGPGREETLNATEKREACEQAGYHHKMGKIKRWPDIFETVAETFRAKGKKVSARTIKRIWESRETLYLG